MKTKLVLLNVVIALVLILSACTPGATQVVQPTNAPAAAATNTTAPEPTKPPEPTATTAAAATTAPAATATTAAPATPGEQVLTIHLKKGLKWSDGTAFTAKDVVGTYDIFWAQSDATWNAITKVEAVDDTTVAFHLKTISPRYLRLILRSNIVRPYAPYAALMDEAAQLREANADRKGDQVKAFLDKLNAFKPTDYLASGPYKIDPASVTEAQLTMVKNPNGYNADKVGFDSLLLYYGETNATVPLVLAGDIDYATHGFTPANIAAFQAMPNIEIIRGPTGTGPGLWFNQKEKNLTYKEVRQAFAYIIDRDENAQVSLGESGKAIKYEAGFTDLQVPTWLDPATIAKLNPYNKDLAKAEQLLTSVGFKKNGNKWTDPDGKDFAVELAVPSDFADWFAAAENAAQQLSDFGINATVRGYQSSERATVQSEGSYQILVDLAIYYSPPHPQTSFNYYLNTPRNNPNTAGQPAGFNWSWTQKDPDTGQDVNIPDLLDKAAAGMDPAAQKPYIATLARIVNEELPVLALFERFTNDPLNTDTTTGSKPLDDPIYQNNQGGDNYIAIQVLDGTMSSKRDDKSFRSAYPYPQPPKAHYNLFTTDSLPVGVGSVHYPLTLAPLFWYMYADAKYVPVLADSYELK
jgi:peptide/nickel transport system substrate-binding protein